MFTETTTIVLCLAGAAVVFFVVLLATAIRVVPEYQRLVVFRLGRCVGSKGPGIVFLVPIIDRGVSTDLREQVREIPHQTSITKDNAAISVDFIWYYKVLDPTESVQTMTAFIVQSSFLGSFEILAASLPLKYFDFAAKYIKTARVTPRYTHELPKLK